MRAPVPVLWWNRTVVAAVQPAAATTILPPEGDGTPAFCAFIASLQVRAIRLIYGSPTLEHSLTTCPKGNRATIQKALSGRYPALAHPTAAWAAHRIRRHDSGSTTLLYIEQEPQLARLRAALSDHGITLEAVFPLLVLAEATPPLDRPGDPALAVLHTDEAAAVYWISPEGDRHAAFFDGPTARERVTQDLVTGLSAFAGKSPPPFAVIHASPAPLELPGLPQTPSHTISVADFLAHAGALSARDTSNFLPPESRWTLDRLCHAAAFVCFMAALVLTGGYLIAARDAQADLALQHAQEEALGQQNAHLRANRKHLEQVNAMLAEVAIAPPVKRQFLEALNRARPASISLRSVALNEATWSLTGYAHEGVNVEKGPFQTFLTAFAKNEGWSLGPDSRTPVLRQPDFTLNGTIP
jgi:cell division protein FtsB